MTMPKKTFLTERQIQILRLRKAGKRQSEIAKILGTTRANISATEKTAKENIKKAEDTVELARMMDAAQWLRIEKDTDLSTVPRKIYEIASKNGIWIKLDTHSVIGLLKEHCENRIKGRRITGEIEVGITSGGSLILR